MIYYRGQRPLRLHPGVLALPRPLRVGGGGPGLLLVRGIPAVRTPGTGDIIHYYIIIIIIIIIITIMMQGAKCAVMWGVGCGRSSYFCWRGNVCLPRSLPCNGDHDDDDDDDDDDVMRLLSPAPPPGPQLRPVPVLPRAGGWPAPAPAPQGQPRPPPHYGGAHPGHTG